MKNLLLNLWLTLGITMTRTISHLWGAHQQQPQPQVLGARKLRLPKMLPLVVVVVVVDRKSSFLL